MNLRKTSKILIKVTDMQEHDFHKYLSTLGAYKDKDAASSFLFIFKQLTPMKLLIEIDF